MTIFDVTPPVQHEQPKRWCATCKDEEALPRRQVGYECWLAKQAPIVRVEAAERRLALVPEHARVSRIKASQCPPGRRWCAGCQTMVQTRHAAGSRCKACSSIAGHTSRIKSEFGIDALTYAWALEKQGGKCAICRQFPKTVRLAVDHDHTMPCSGGEHDPKRGCPKCIRGLLCSKCNGELLPAVYHNVDVVQNALAYLTLWPFQDNGWTMPQAELDAWKEAHGDGDPAPY